MAVASCGAARAEAIPPPGPGAARHGGGFPCPRTGGSATAHDSAGE